MQFKPNLDQNYATKNFEMYDGKQQLDQSNVSQFNKTTTFCLEQGQFRPNLGQNYTILHLMIHSLKIFLNFYGMRRHNR